MKNIEYKVKATYNLKHQVFHIFLVLYYCESVGIKYTILDIYHDSSKASLVAYKAYIPSKYSIYILTYINISILNWKVMWHCVMNILSNSPITPTLARQITQAWFWLTALVHVLGNQSLQPVRIQPLDSFYQHTSQLQWWVATSNVASTFVSINRHVLRIHRVLNSNTTINCLAIK